MSERIRSTKGVRPIVALTCYDYTSAKILNDAQIDLILVGDSLGMVMLGYENTHFVTMEDMIRSTQAVLRGNREALVVFDMPIGTCETAEIAIKNCQRLQSETGLKTVKIEGRPEIAKALCSAGFEVMGHTGLKPQEVDHFSVQGRNDQAQQIMAEAKALEEAGAFSIILECIPWELAKNITATIKIPTFGIGAGKYCDGQMLVMHDVLGLFDDFKPKFVRRYGNFKEEMIEALRLYADDVRQGKFPGEEESYS